MSSDIIEPPSTNAAIVMESYDDLPPEWRALAREFHHSKVEMYFMHGISLEETRKRLYPSK